METTCMHAIRSLLAAAGVLFASVLVQSAATAEGPARQDATLPSVDATDPGIRLDLLSERFRELEEAGALRNYRFAGRPDPALRAWLDESRRVVDELAELRRANPRPELDRSQGFALLLPHLAELGGACVALATAQANKRIRHRASEIPEGGIRLPSRGACIGDIPLRPFGGDESGLEVRLERAHRVRAELDAER